MMMKLTMKMMIIMMLLITAPPTKRKHFLFLSVRFGISIQTLLSFEWQILYQIRILVHRNIIQLHFFKLKMQSASIQFRFIKLIALKKSETALDKIELCAEKNDDNVFYDC